MSKTTVKQEQEVPQVRPGIYLPTLVKNSLWCSSCRYIRPQWVTGSTSVHVHHRHTPTSYLWTQSPKWIPFLVWLTHTHINTHRIVVSTPNDNLLFITTHVSVKSSSDAGQRLHHKRASGAQLCGHLYALTEFQTNKHSGGQLEYLASLSVQHSVYTSAKTTLKYNWNIG